MKKINKNKGFLSVEMLVAFAIITTAIIATTSVAQNSIRLARQTLHMAQAADLLEEGAEMIHAVRDSSGRLWKPWGSPLSWISAGVVSCPTDSSDGPWQWWPTQTSQPSFCQVGIFTRTVVLGDVYRDGNGNIVSSGGNYDRFTRLVTITVTWSEEGMNKSKTLQFYINDLTNS